MKKALKDCHKSPNTAYQKSNLPPAEYSSSAFVARKENPCQHPPKSIQHLFFCSAWTENMWPCFAKNKDSQNEKTINFPS